MGIQDNALMEIVCKGDSLGKPVDNVVGLLCVSLAGSVRSPRQPLENAIRRHRKAPADLLPNLSGRALPTICSVCKMFPRVLPRGPRIGYNAGRSDEPRGGSGTAIQGGCVEQKPGASLIVKDDRRLGRLTREYPEEGNGLVDIEANGDWRRRVSLRRTPGPGGARPDAAGRGRPVHLPPGAPAVRRSDPDAHRAHRRYGRGYRPGDGRRRLRVQSRCARDVLLARIPCPVAAQRGAGSGRPGGGQQTPGVRSPGDRQRDARGLAGRDHHRADQRRIRPALAAGGERRAHSLPRGDLQRPARHRLRRPGTAPSTCASRGSARRSATTRCTRG